VLKVRRAAAVALAAGTALAAVTGAGSAAASPMDHHYSLHQLPGDYVGPLQFAVSGHTVAVADSFASALYLVGHKDPIATGFPPTQTEEASGDLAGVAINNGRIAYTTTKADHKTTLLVVLKHGKKVLTVNLGAYEQRVNPDRTVTYGAVDPAAVPAACTAALAQFGVPLQYTGAKDSHPYAVTGLRDGSWLVADAGGNDILRVSPRGHISTVAVLPANRLTITAEMAAGLGAPACKGVDYRFEGVPTDVEVTRQGVYVSSLGGAPEIGAVYKLGNHGRLWKLAGGIPGATNLAVSPSGRVYVVELGVGIFALGKYGLNKVLDLPNAAAAEWANGRLYASTAPIAASQGKDKSMGHIFVVR
jgi:hypothetical protein